jgi:hypothetical protein
MRKKPVKINRSDKGIKLHVCMEILNRKIQICYSYLICYFGNWNCVFENSSTVRAISFFYSLKKIIKMNVLKLKLIEKNVERYLNSTWNKVCYFLLLTVEKRNTKILQITWKFDISNNSLNLAFNTLHVIWIWTYTSHQPQYLSLHWALTKLM